MVIILFWEFTSFKSINRSAKSTLNGILILVDVSNFANVHYNRTTEDTEWPGKKISWHISYTYQIRFTICPLVKILHTYEIFSFKILLAITIYIAYHNNVFQFVKVYNYSQKGILTHWHLKFAIL